LNAENEHVPYTARFSALTSSSVNVIAQTNNGSSIQVKGLWSGRRDQRLLTDPLIAPGLQRTEFTAQVGKIPNPARWLFLTLSNKTKLQQIKYNKSTFVIFENRRIKEQKENA